MACEIVKCCQFFKDNMKNLPKSAEYLQNKFCFGDYASCNRYRIYLETGGTHIPFDLYPDDVEAIRKVKECLLEKQDAQE